MTARRWWDLIVAGSLLVLTVITIDGAGVSAGERFGGLLSIGAVGLAYLVWGRRMLRPTVDAAMPGDSGFDHTAFPLSARLFGITLIAACGAATAFDPNLATIQALAFPILWALSPSFVGAVVLSALLSVSTGLGLWVGLGGTIDAAVQATAIEAISFVFALAMGTWITRIADAGAAQRRLVQQLTLAQDELAAAHRAAGSAAERERLAREIHDTIAQSLTSLVMLSQRSRVELAAVGGDTTAVADSIDLIESTGRDALTEARSLVASMSPVRTADGDLAHTLTRLVERFERETGITVTVDLAGLGQTGVPGGASAATGTAAGATGAALDRALEVVLLRCAQEGLANIRKHSRARAARIGIELNGPDIVLTVADNGRGLGDYAPTTENGFGLAGMRDRLALVGGSLEVTDGLGVWGTATATGAGDGCGTVLRVTLPVGPANAPAVPAAALLGASDGRA